jgi:2'-5' RNA ligase
METENVLGPDRQPRPPALNDVAAERLREAAILLAHQGDNPYRVAAYRRAADAVAALDTDLRAALLQAYGQADQRPFRPHVTIARIRGDGQSVAIDREISLGQRVESVELYQSPPPGGVGYQIITSERLGENTQDAQPAAP